MNRLPVERRYWSAKEAAEYIGLHPQTLRRYCKPPPDPVPRQRWLKSAPPTRIFGTRTIRFPIDAFKKWADGVNLGPTRR